MNPTLRLLAFQRDLHQCPSPFDWNNDLDDLKNLSIRSIILELYAEGRLGSFPEIEPLSELELLAELEHRTKKEFGNNLEEWMEWYIADQTYQTLEGKVGMSHVLTSYRRQKSKRGAGFTAPDNGFP